MRPIGLSLILLLALLMCWPGATLAQAGPRAVSLQPGEAPPHIDGRLDDAVWQRAPAHDRFFRYLPTDGEPAPAELRTAVQVAVDEQALYVAIRAWDDQPEAMRSTLSRRDQVKSDQDFVSVFLDPLGHRRAAQFVRVSMAGGMADGLYRAETDEEDYGPDFPVQAASQRLADGYSVELRWPLSSLRYAYEDGGDWRLMVARSVPHAGNLLLVSAPLTKGSLSFIAELQAIEGLSDTVRAVRERSFLEFRPELTARRGRQGAAGAVAESGQAQLSLGAELNWRLRADWMFNATLNPDFSQVELDVPPSTGASRVALSLPEKRGFFLESADVLGLALPAFYSRTVADPRWGLRATWRGAQADATALSLEDRPGGVLLRGSAYATLAYAQTRPSQASLWRGHWQGEPASAGVVYAQRDHGEGRRNQVLGADTQWRLHGLAGEPEAELFASGVLMGSENTAGFDPQGLPVRLASQTGWHGSGQLRFSSPKWFVLGEATGVTPEFVNDNGFVAQAGITQARLEINRRLHDSEWGWGDWTMPVFEHEAQLWLEEARTQADPSRGVLGGELLSRTLQAGLWFTAPLRSNAWLHLAARQQRAHTTGQVHDTPALVGGFETLPLPWLTRVNSEFQFGRQLDAEADRVGPGGNATLEAQMRFALPRGWSLESDHHFSRAWVREGGRSVFAESTWRWLTTLHLSPRDSVRGIVQRSRQIRLPSGAALAVVDGHQHHVSLMWRHIWGHGQTWSAGWVREKQAPGALWQRETTVKLMWQWAV